MKPSTCSEIAMRRTKSENQLNLPPPNGKLYESSIENGKVDLKILPLNDQCSKLIGANRILKSEQMVYEAKFEELKRNARNMKDRAEELQRLVLELSNQNVEL